MLFQKNERIRFTVRQIGDAGRAISAAISEGQAVLRRTKDFLDTTTESLYGILDIAKNNLEGLVREISSLHEKLTDIGTEMASMVDVPLPSSVAMFQDPNAPYRGNHNYTMLSSQLAQHTALYGTPNAGYEKLREEQSFLEGELLGLEKRKSELEYVIENCEAHLNTLQAIREELCQSGEDPLAPLYHAQSVADEAEGCATVAAREMGQMIGRAGAWQSIRVDTDDPAAFGRAAAGLKAAVFKMRAEEDELHRRMRTHRHNLPKSNIMDSVEQAVDTELRVAERAAEGIEVKIRSLSKIEKALKEYSALTREFGN